MIALFGDARLTPAAKVVAVTLLSFQNDAEPWSYPSLEKISLRAGIAKRSAASAIVQLEHRGWFIVHHAGRRPGRAHFNRYEPVIERPRLSAEIAMKQEQPGADARLAVPAAIGQSMQLLHLNGEGKQCNPRREKVQFAQQNNAIPASKPSSEPSFEPSARAREAMTMEERASAEARAKATLSTAEFNAWLAECLSGNPGRRNRALARFAPAKRCAPGTRP